MAHADFPAYRGRMEYVCLDCGARHPGDSLLLPASCPAVTLTGRGQALISQC